jgi:ribosomal protein L39E
MKEHDGPKLKGNVLSRLTFWPATPLVRAGAKKPIEKKQLFRLEKPNRTTTVWKRFKKNWKLEENEKEYANLLVVTMQRRRNAEVLKFPSLADRISVFRAVRRTFLVEWLSCILLQTTFGTTTKKNQPAGLIKLGKGRTNVCRPQTAAFQFTSPVLLPYLLDYLNDPTIPDWHGYLYVIAIFLSAVIGALFFYHSNLRAFSLGIKIRAALTQLIYYKALRVSSSQSSSSGQITNLVTSDAQIIQDTLVFFNQGFIAPVQIIVCTGLIWPQLGPFALISIGLLVVVFPLNIWFARLTSKYRFLQQKATDVRVKFMREVINAIRIVKYYAYVQHFELSIKLSI